MRLLIARYLTNEISIQLQISVWREILSFFEYFLFITSFWLLIYLVIFIKNNRELTDWIRKQDAYVEEQEAYINQQHELINQWADAYNFVLNENEEYADMLERYLEVGIHTKTKFDSVKDIDDFFIQATTKEFIQQMAWKGATEKDNSSNVIDLNKQKEIKENIRIIENNFKLIKPRFTEAGLSEIRTLIKDETIRLTRYENS